MSQTDAEFVADMEWLHSHDREAALPPEKLARLFALARRGAAMQWRPIETAPKDGTVFLAWCQGKHWRTGEHQTYWGLMHWDTKHRQETFVHYWDGDPSQWFPPTHWMPLPPPPAGEPEQE